jgi:hypothetical protein
LRRHSSRIEQLLKIVVDIFDGLLKIAALINFPRPDYYSSPPLTGGEQYSPADRCGWEAVVI